MGGVPLYAPGDLVVVDPAAVRSCRDLMGVAEPAPGSWFGEAVPDRAKPGPVAAAAGGSQDRDPGDVAGLADPATEGTEVGGPLFS